MIQSLYSHSVLVICNVSAYCSGTNDSDAFLISHLDHLPCLSLRDPLSNYGDSMDLRVK